MPNSSTTIKGKAVGSNRPALSPKRDTVEFLKKFARIYTYSAMMPIGLGAFMAN